MRGILTCVMATAILAGCTTNGGNDRARSDWGRYDYNRPDPSYGGYDAGRYYRESTEQGERRLTQKERY